MADGSAKLLIYPLVGKAGFQTMERFAYDPSYGSASSATAYYGAFSRLLTELSSPSFLTLSFGMSPEQLTILPHYRTMCQDRHSVHDHLLHVVERRKAESVESPDVFQQRKDVLSKLIAKNPDMDSGAIKSELFTFFFAGHDTTSSSATFVFYFLATLSMYHDLVQAEADKLMSCEPEALARMTLKDLETMMPMLTAVVLESGRLFPAAAQTLSRTPTRDTKLGDYNIPKGCRILISILDVNRDVKVWGDDAAEFRPERFFVNGNVLEGLDHAQSKKLLTFGAGHRVCLGMFFARFQLLLGVATLMHRFNFKLPKGSRHEAQPISRGKTAFLAPVDLELIVTRREKPTGSAEAGTKLKED